MERAYLDNARSGPVRDRVAAETTRLLQGFEAAGAVQVDPPALLAADTLLDLYGEHIRANAYLTRDDEGEQVLRPDFTVPIAQQHMAQAAEPARYAYAGPVWRKQSEEARNREYLQVGLEIYDADAANADADVFATVAGLLAPYGLSIATGDMGLVLAAIDSLNTSDIRKAALRRHLWRPARFQMLLNRFGKGHADWVAERSSLIELSLSGQSAKAIKSAGKAVGLRSVKDVETRLARLAKDADTPPLEEAEVALIAQVLALTGSLADVLEHLPDLAARSQQLATAVEQFQARSDALAGRGLDLRSIPFEGSFGRTRLEYYDGFVFGFHAPHRKDLPALATGGRYDALTRQLGQGRSVPAVGAMIRPEALIALGEV